jgi:predicted RNase H-like nuclease
MLDQPTIVTNTSGQRHVEKIVCPSIGVRYGGMQPANTARIDMFGSAAPIWSFMARFGGAADPLGPSQQICVFETYPVLAMIALGWTLPDSREKGRLPKYNPTRKKTFSLPDWQHVCVQAREAFHHRGLVEIAEWTDRNRNLSPRKQDQDCLDACICLLVGLHLVEQKECMMVGDQTSGYIVVPHSDMLREEIEQRCLQTGLPPSDSIRIFQLPRPQET